MNDELLDAFAAVITEQANEIANLEEQLQQALDEQSETQRWGEQQAWQANENRLRAQRASAEAQDAETRAINARRDADYHAGLSRRRGWL